MPSAKANLFAFCRGAALIKRALRSLRPAGFSCSFFRRKSQRKPRGENDREAAAHLAERSQKTTLFCTIVPGAQCATASASDIFTSRRQAGLRPAERTIQPQFVLESCFFTGRRPARPHCEKRGRSGGAGASARSGCAKQRSLSCPLSERRRRHPRLFAVLDLLVLLGQAKSTKKMIAGFSLRKNRTACFAAGLRAASFLALSFEESAKEDREAKTIGKLPLTSQNDHERLRLSHDRSGHSVCGSFFVRHFHIAEAGRSATCRENDTTTIRVGILLFHKPKACTTALRKARKKWRNRCKHPKDLRRLAPRGPKPPPAEARQKSVRSAAFDPQISCRKSFLAFFKERAAESGRSAAR